MSEFMRAVLPDSADLVYAEMYDDPSHLAALPEEEALIARSVAKRRNEFITARHCARVAMAQLGVPPAPILKGDKGEPHWPDGVVGSLTHCEGYRGAVVGRSVAVRSVGIDAEPHGVLPTGSACRSSARRYPCCPQSCVGTEFCSAPRKPPIRHGSR
jgi:4'-phosphopantetheinyl transferase EntD